MTHSVNSSGIRDFALLLGLSAVAVLIHGYHPGVEDAEIYLPGIKKILNPALYPRGSEFFQSHAGMTMFPNVIAWSVRLTHLPLEFVLFIWHVLSIFLLLYGCLKIARLCFASQAARWGGVVLVASLLTIPVAGTALYILDQYVNSRSLSTPALVLAIAAVLERKYIPAASWIAFTAAVHPLMSVFGMCFLVILTWIRSRSSRAASILPAAAFFPPVTRAYRESLQLHSYFSLRNWEWFEWLGAIAPLGLLLWFEKLARHRGMETVQVLSRSLLIFGLCFFGLALILAFPPQLENLAELQPMRCFHLIYIFLFLLIGGFLGEWLLQNHVWRWLVLFVPLCAGMWYAQIQLFRASPHIEWPGQAPRNPWLAAFSWIQQNTPVDAYFALDPEHMKAPEEDEHGFRALAERGRMADNVKDSGAVSMFPALAGEWHDQVHALSRWKQFRIEDFRDLKRRYGIDWIVLERPGVSDLDCPYSNDRVLVCRID